MWIAFVVCEIGADFYLGQLQGIKFKFKL